MMNLRMLYESDHENAPKKKNTVNTTISMINIQRIPMEQDDSSCIKPSFSARNSQPIE